MKTVAVIASSFLSFFSSQVLAAQIPTDSSLAQVKSHGVLRVCSDAGFLPFEMKTDKGTWDGFDVEMMKAFAQSVSVKLEMVQINFDGIIPALITKKCDLIAAGMTVTPQRAEKVLFSDYTFKNGLSIAFKNNEENKSKYKNLLSLDQNDIKIAVRSGTTSDLYLSKTLKNAQILRFDADADLTLSILQGRANAFVADTTYVSLMSDANKGRIFIEPTDLTAEEFSIAGRKEDLALMQNFNTFLKSWKSNGGYAQAEKYYFKDKTWRVALQ